MTDPTPVTPPDSTTPRRWRVLAWLLGVLVLVMLLPVGTWWWASSEGSLQRALQMAQRFLPEDQALQYSDVRGSITGGGRVGRLQWSKPGMALTIDDLRLAWSLRGLFGRALHVRTLQAANVHLRLTPQPEQPPAEPFTMPADVSLPIEVTLPLVVSRVQVETVDAAGVASTQVIDDLALRYGFDGTQHALELESLRYGQSSARAQVHLHARELTLGGEVTASLRDLVPDTPFAMLARLQAQGTLAGGDAASLALRLEGTEQARDGAPPDQGARLQAQATLHPWRAQPMQQLQLQASRLNARAFHGAAPATAFRGRASLQPVAGSAGDAWDLLADFTNDQPGAWQQHVPLRTLVARGRLGGEALAIETARVELAGSRRAGTMTMAGRIPFAQPTQATLRLDLQRIDLQPLMEGLPRTALDGTASVQPAASTGNSPPALAFDADISGAVVAEAARQRAQVRAIQARGSWSPQRLAVQRIHLDAFEAKVDGSDVEMALPGLESIRARMTASAPGVVLEADAAMLRQSGGGKLSLQLVSATQAMAWLRGLPVIGERLPPSQATGTASLRAEWRGGWRQWRDGLANPARYPQLRVDAGLDAQALRIELPAATAGETPTRIGADRLQARVQGNLASASLTVDGDLRANDTRADLDVGLRMAQAGNARAPQWNVTVDRLAVAATLPKQAHAWQLRVSEGLQVTAQTGQALAIRTTAGTATLSPPAGTASGDQPLEVAWQPLRWSRSAAGATSLQSVGTIRGIQPGWLDTLLAPEGEGPLAGAGMRTDLRLSGGWDIRMAERLDIRAELKRDSGDVWLLEPVLGPADAPVDDIAAGIRTFGIQVRSEGEDVAAALDWDTERAGTITARVRTRLARQAGGWSLPEAAPLSGSVQARVQDLGAWGFLAPPGWRVRGALDADVTLAGSVQAPRLQGGIEGRGLNIRSVLDGVDLHDGVLRATFNGQRLDIAELTLQGGTGSRAYVRGLSGNRTQPPTERGRMTASGSIDWSGAGRAGARGSGIAMDVRASLQRMQVLVRNDRQLSLSGELAAGLQQGALRVRGDIRVDRATILLPEASAPTLGDDVQVVRGGVRHDDAVAGTRPEPRGQLETAQPMDVEVKLDLGRDLALQGQGITTRLEGQLTVRSNPGGGDPFRVVGEVRTDQGRYRAWGQALNVETGVVQFNGPYANPALNLVAIRPEIEVRAGVRVTGTLTAPRLQLFSDPEMPEAEKLSWVVLGRATASTGAEGASMQRAALGLLAGRVGSGLASGLGVDEIALAETGVSIGKRISNEFYLTYEAGLSGAASTLYIFYDITRRFTVRGQTGEASAVDLIYTITYD